MKNVNLLLTTAIVALLGTSVSAQTVFGDSDAQTRNEALNESIADDFESDTTRFGNDGRTLGFDGSISMQANTTSGNTDTASVGLGVDLGWYDGTNGYQAQLSYQYSDDNGSATEDSLLYDLQYTRDFGSAYYGFAQLTGTVESLPFDTSDNYLGAGVGYRIYNTDDLRLTVQGGVGYRVADLNSVDDLEEGAISLSSDYYNRLNDTVYLTNDLDIIASDSDTVVFNDIGVNVAMSETLALRTSLRTEYHTDPAPGRDDTDNSLGLSLVYNLN